MPAPQQWAMSNGQPLRMAAPTQQRPAAPMAQRPAAPQQPRPAGPTQWQTAGVTAPQPPAVVRGVAHETPKKFVLPRPEALGVSTQLALHPTAAPVSTPQTTVDWNQIQARMERLRVVGYSKAAQPGGVRVMLVLPTADPSQRQPFEAQAATEAAAIQIALGQAETWVQTRGQ